MSLWNSLNSVTKTLADASITQLNASLEEARSRIDKALEIDESENQGNPESSEITHPKVIESSTDLASDVLGSLNSSYNENAETSKPIPSSNRSRRSNEARKNSSKSIFSGNSILSGLSTYTGLSSFDSHGGSQKNDLKLEKPETKEITKQQIQDILSKEESSSGKKFPVLQNDELLV